MMLRFTGMGHLHCRSACKHTTVQFCEGKASQAVAGVIFFLCEDTKVYLISTGW